MTRYSVRDEEQNDDEAREVRLTGFTPTDLASTLHPQYDAPNISERLSASTLPDTTKMTSGISGSEDPERGVGCSSGSKWLCRRMKRSFTKKMLYRRIPIFSWLPKYNKEYAISDLVAGLTVGLTVIPQGIAYAGVAGLPPQYGLYSSFMACFVYTILGPCKDVPVGPTAIAAILTKETVEKANLPPEFAVLLTFISGGVMLIMGILQLGFLIDFISGPVSVGFTSAAAIIIATSQVKDILGLDFTAGKFLNVWQEIFQHIGETKLWDAVLGVTCIIVLLLLRKVKDIPIISKDSKEPTPVQKTVLNCLWFISTARNILIVVLCSVGTYLLEARLGSSPVFLTGYVKPGLPSFQSPSFTAQIANETYHFGDMVTALGSGCFVVPLLSLLESIAISKVFSDGKPIDATQEMLALGTGNIISSFVSSIPVTGGLSRGAVNNASGVKTTMGGVYTGIMVLLSLQFLTPYFYYIPKAALAAVIIAAVVFMVEFHVIKPMWRTKKLDLIPAFATFVCCLFIRLELGIVIGIGINLLFLLYASARPTLNVHKATSAAGCEHLVITPDRSLVFPSVEYVRAVVSKQGLRQGNAVPVVIDSTHIQAADFTAAKGIKSLAEDFASRGQPLLFYNLKPSVVEIFRGVKPSELRCCASETELNDYLKEFSNLSTNLATRH